MCCVVVRYGNLKNQLAAAVQLTQERLAIKKPRVGKFFGRSLGVSLVEDSFFAYAVRGGMGVLLGE
jgi:hypothetical protein